MKKILILCCLFIISSLPVYSQEIPSGGESVVVANAALKMTLSGSAYARKKNVAISDMPFTEAVEVETFQEPAQSWDTQLSLSTIAAIEKDDVLLAIFYARGVQATLETGEIQSELIFERSSDPWTKSVTYPILVGGEWQLFYVPFICAEDYAAGESSIKFRCGYAPQIFQLGGLQVINYKKNLAIDSLPRTTINYAGRESDAPWRAQADQMIDQYRKADIQVHVKDAAGQPVQNATILLKMQKHAYKFGSAVDANTLSRVDWTGGIYTETILTYFNRVVMENDLKWSRWEQESQRRVTLSALNYLISNGIEIRGHCLVWPSWERMPDDLEQHKDDPEYLRTRVMEHIEEEVSEVKECVVDWDVINEPYWNHDLMDILGDEVMVDWFNQARYYNADAKLYLNDNNIISASGLDRQHQQHFYDTVEFLQSHNAPIQGIGTQCHFGDNVTPPERIWTILDKLAGYGLEIQATEFDVSTDDTELQTDYTRDFMTAYFAHPATVGILMWGFWAGQHWKPNAALWDDNWQLRPHGKAWVDLVTKTWWTNETLKSDNEGAANLRGFLGEYLLEIQYGAQTLSATFSHQKGGTEITATGDTIKVNHQLTNVQIEKTTKIDGFRLMPNFPNPFNATTTIRYSVPQTNPVSIRIFNNRGQLVRVLVNKAHQPGEYQTKWDGATQNGQQVSSGLYFCKMTTGEFLQIQKMVLMK